ncbi:MAG TPA: N-acetylmuramoyl-L-alanine amidase [Nitrospirota bacterium]|nr:N-acetylmuramoyl-L-alanine amidase [Nitrospirota bacterium]
MRKFFVLSIAVLITAAALFSSAGNAAAASPDAALYRKAELKYTRLQADKKKRRMRHLWEGCMADLDGLVERYPKSAYAGKAAFLKAEASAGMYRVSRTQRDLDAAVEAYEQYLERYPKASGSQAAKKALKALTGVDYAAPARAAPAITDAARPGNPPVIEVVPAAGTAQTVAPDGDRPAHAPGIVSVREIRHWSNQGYTRVVIDLDGEVRYEARRIKGPDRLFFDIRRARVAGAAKDAVNINDGILRTVRASQYDADTVRVVLDLASLADYKALMLSNPARLVVDVTGKDAVRRTRGGRVITLRSIDGRGNAPVLAPAEKAPPTREENAAAVPAHVPAVETAAASVSTPIGICIGTIVIDPGHGGKDTGAIGRNGLLEKDVVLDVGLRLREIIRRELGCKVIMTRDRDVFIDLDARPGIAVQHDADLFISVHANASRNSTARGIETYLLNLTKDRNIMEVAARENMTTLKNMGALEAILKDLILDSKRDESLRLAHAIQDGLVKSLLREGRASFNKGVKQGPFLVLYGASMPSILTEVGFISNPDEESLLGSPGYRQEIAQAIFDGIKDYVSTSTVASYAQETPAL